MNFHDQNRSCHAEGSEASLCPSRQTLRCAQGDNTFPILIVELHYRGEFLFLFATEPFLQPTVDKAPTRAESRIPRTARRWPGRSLHVPPRCASERSTSQSRGWSPESMQP